MSKIVPADIIHGGNQGEIPVSNLKADYQVQIEIVLIGSGVQSARELLITKDGENTIGTVYVIDKDICRKYLPSRVYWDESVKDFALMYYTNPHLNPPRFLEDDEMLYCVTVPLLHASVYKYDMRARVFIDQIKVGTEMFCVFLFGSRDAELLVLPMQNG